MHDPENQRFGTAERRQIKQQAAHKAQDGE